MPLGLAVSIIILQQIHNGYLHKPHLVSELSVLLKKISVLGGLRRMKLFFVLKYLIQAPDLREENWNQDYNHNMN